MKIQLSISLRIRDMLGTFPVKKRRAELRLRPAQPDGGKVTMTKLLSIEVVRSYILRHKPDIWG